jgi:ribonuclease HI
MTEPVRSSEPSERPAVTIYTDGGADPNPGPGGWGAVLLHEATGSVKELNGGEPHTTNNRMELTAAIRSLEALRETCRVRLFTDSLYLKKGITQWLAGWIARGWKRKDGELQNEDLWRLLAELVKKHQIEWGWVKGHAGHRWNERADQLATEAIRAQRAASGKALPGSPQGIAPPVDAEVYLRVSSAGREGGWAALIRHGGEENVITRTGAGLTPNQLDIVSAAEALETLPPGITVAVHTGSDYLRNGATAWIQGWKKRNWATQEGKPVSNRALWERLDKALTSRKVLWPQTKGRQLPEFETLGAAAKQAAGREAKKKPVQ